MTPTTTTVSMVANLRQACRSASATYTSVSMAGNHRLTRVFATTRSFSHRGASSLTMGDSQ